VLIRQKETHPVLRIALLESLQGAQRTQGAQKRVGRLVGWLEGSDFPQPGKVGQFLYIEKEKLRGKAREEKGLMSVEPLSPMYA